MRIVTRGLRAIAQSFVSARQEARALTAFPGEAPADLSHAYRVQDEAITLWREPVAGWKIGRVPPEQVGALGAERIAGPIFPSFVWQAASEQPVSFPVYEGGFAAVEAECVFRIAKNAPAKKTSWSVEEAADLVAAMHIGVETAGSPLATINDLGSTVVVSDFGNNHGLILGPAIEDWRGKLARGVEAATFIDGKEVGSGVSAERDGPLEALVFLAGHLSERGRPLKAGQYVSTGAMTGVHDIAIGQKARVSFNGSGDIYCAAVRATPTGSNTA